MKLATLVAPLSWNAERWSAFLTVDGEPTTFDCSHCHHTADAARKCEADILKRATKVVTNPTFREVVIDADRRLVEWQYEATVKTRFVPDYVSTHMCRLIKGQTS
jgi:hypothetical protein